MAKKGNPIHIPLRECEAVRLLGKVRPTAEMPRQGSHPTIAKPKGKARKKRAT